ncbi:Rtf2 RING-finger-domain-containing protein [Podospora appendiculata]|uniref:Rtf2 RING-finger-domain-containing protein n=1 Tax=Podospora appendiculata TaxID=314037 RepID=A0AAE0X0S0_9PEZI|nr:Rtf2 RING-finger-domain-containing protein [Podospora appendiculata]
MGNDGGSIPTRRELVKNAARNPTVSELKATALESLAHAWSFDPLTSEPIDLESVVSDWRGRLYNYESILKALIPSDNGGDDKDNNDATPPPALVNGESPELGFASTGIKSLRDIVKLKFKRHAPPGAKEKEVWACPVSLRELGPSTKSVYLVPCGHVFAEIAMKQLQEGDTACPECSEQFKTEDVIPILPIDKADIQRLTARLEDLKARGLTHSLKKEKSANKKKKRKADDEANGDDAGKTKRDGEKASKAPKTPKSDIASRVSGINNAMTASLTARVLAEQVERNKKRRLAAAN